MNRAWLSVRPEFLRDRLGLPADVEIVRIDMNGENFELRLGLQGESLPAVAEGAMLPTVMLLLYQTEDPTTGIRKTEGSWSHAPETRWLIDERPIPPIASRKNGEPSMTATSELEYRIGKLELKTGDVLIVKHDGHLTAEQAERVRRTFKLLVQNSKVFVIDRGTDLSVLTAAEIAGLAS